MTPIERERFWAKVDASGDCWVWTGNRQHAGYGHAWIGRRWVRAHRAAYMELVGPIPAGLVLDHLCRNPPCVNPDHLQPVDRRTNVIRGYMVTAANARRSRSTELYAKLVAARPQSRNRRDQPSKRTPEFRAMNRERMWAFYRTPRGRAQRAASSARVRFGEDVPWQTFMAIMGQGCAACGTAPAGGVDHILPRARGGRNIEANLQPMCLSCNQRKGAKVAT